jgi:hypothetical protein
LLFTGGLLTFKGSKIGSGIGYMIGIVVTIVGVIMVLSFFPSLIDQLDTTLTAISSDTIGVLFLGTVVPLLIYLMVAVAPAVVGGVGAYRSSRKGKISGSSEF